MRTVPIANAARSVSSVPMPVLDR